MKEWIAGVAMVFTAGGVSADTVEIDTKDYIKLVVGNYVHGFKEFDTTTTVIDQTVSIGIYYHRDDVEQSAENESRAKQLAKRFRAQIPHILERYSWAKDMKTVVSVYSEDRAKGY